VFLKEVNAVTAVTAGIRRWGAAALDLAYVAAGRLDGFWERDLSPWDTAAGILLVREAGGQVSTIKGNTYKFDGDGILAANLDLHTDLVKLLRSAREK
jgi:myo-inositol-1(or 4)-monophosphatase